MASKQEIDREISALRLNMIPLTRNLREFRTGHRAALTKDYKIHCAMTIAAMLRKLDPILQRLHELLGEHHNDPKL